MSVLTIFHTWLTGDVLTATNLNGNNTNIQTAVNNIDNTNIGSAGIFASQIKPTSGAQATFGGSLLYQMLHGLDVFAGADATVPLLVSGNSATQSADLIDAYQNHGSTLVFSVSPAGNVACAGNLQAASDGTHQSYVPPAYTSTGAAVASTFHIVSGTATVLNGNSTVTVNLTNAAVFANGNYQVMLTLTTLGNSPVIFTQSKNTNSFVINISTTAGPGGIPIDWVAMGA